MASDQTAVVNKLRKLRKKLRQVETLQRLHGVRELTEEEIAKVSRRDEIRGELREMLASFSVDQQEMKLYENGASKVDDNCAATAAQEKSQAEQEGVFEQKLANDQVNQDKDTVMDSESENQEEMEKKHDGLAKEESIHDSNETDDKKVENIGMKKKDTKRKVDNPKYWKQMQFSVKAIEGHHHPLCAVDFDEQHIISGGHDTSLKIWSANTYEELFSLGGHTGGISAALLISEDRAVTGSQDCSVMFWDVKSGKSLSSIYVYNPVSCLAHNNKGILAIGNDGGKVDIYSFEKESITISSKIFDDPLVSLVFTDDGKLACASVDGIVRTYELRNHELVQISDTYDNITSIVSFKNDASPADTPNTNLLNLPLRKINCIASFKDMIFWGDDGYNVKAYGLASGSVIKLRNNLTEYSPTDAMTVLRDGDNGYLFCAGFDIDTGSGYVNVRRLPEMDYLGTISDGTLGHVSSIAASIVGGKIQLVTGGSELRVWSETSNGKKRRASDEPSDVIPCKFVRSYNIVRDSEEEESDSETEVEEEEEEANTSSTVDTEQRKSWCVLQ